MAVVPKTMSRLWYAGLRRLSKPHPVSKANKIRFDSSPTSMSTGGMSNTVPTDRVEQRQCAKHNH